jgi:hypothetical protein
MLKYIVLTIVLILLSSCGGSQQVNTIDSRPLSENQAIEIISKVLSQRGYSATVDQMVTLSNGATVVCDIRVANESISIEYLNKQDKVEVGSVPPPATGSRLHVLPAQFKDASEAVSSMYVFLLDEDKYVYQHNPTSDMRADVTYHEVESRLTRDLNDFISWYESRPQ